MLCSFARTDTVPVKHDSIEDCNISQARLTKFLNFCRCLVKRARDRMIASCHMNGRDSIFSRKSCQSAGYRRVICGLCFQRVGIDEARFIVTAVKDLEQPSGRTWTSYNRMSWVSFLLFAFAGTGDWTLPCARAFRCPC